MTERLVVTTLFPGVQSLDAVGPFEVLHAANRVLDAQKLPAPRYKLVLAAVESGPVRSESGLGMVADRALRNVRGPIDTLLIPGGDGAQEDHPELVTWIAKNSGRAERIATVCTGTFLAAKAGLLNDKTVTTHWSRAGQLATEHPSAVVDPDPIYIQDGKVWSSAGVTSGIDLALALVETDCGPHVARVVARYLVVYLHRPGGQSQFAAPVWSKAAEGQPIKTACEIIHRELDGDLSATALAARVGLSPRHFTRRFRAEIGEPVGRHVERFRVEAARQILETESVGLDDVARRCGFGTAETLRRSFHRRLSISPAAYRRQFSSAS